MADAIINKNLASDVSSLNSDLSNVEDAVSDTQSMIAYVNTNSITASKSYVRNEKFILDGLLRKAKTAIASGATLVLGSNYENTDDVMTQMDNYIRFKAFSETNHTITHHSTSGAYYSDTEVDVTLDGYAAIAVQVTGWSGLAANISPYLVGDWTTGYHVGFTCDSSITVSSLQFHVVYKKVTW